MSRRIGIMGGTFNPIHYGHLIIAENARQQYQLDMVLFMPTGLMPHKAYGGVDMTRHRCNMVALAIEGNEAFGLSTYEVDRQETNYTYQTLSAMQQLYPDAELYFIMGADSLFDFEKWRCPEKIVTQATVLAAVRDYMTESKVDEQILYLRRLYGENIYRLDSPNFNVSSKSIRERCRQGESIRYMIPKSVYEYIIDNRLYME